MKPLFDLTILSNISAQDDLPFECQWCGKTFYRQAKWIRSDLKIGRDRNKYCGHKCHTLSSKRKIKEECGNCHKEIFILPSQGRAKSKSGKVFCSRSCRATYSNKHKTTGNRRSKLEVWLEKQLTNNFPQLTILYNKKEAIKSELDIYIPSLNLAFELNGVFHYEPIFGAEKLASIQNNDNRKFQACLEKDIELVIIDVSALKYFKPANVSKYYDIINNIILSKIGLASGG